MVEDAEALLKGGRHARAASLAILAIEEAGKPSIIRQIVAAANADQLREHWRAFRSHTSKNAAATILDAMRLTGKAKVEEYRVEDFASLYDDNSDHPAEVDAVKQIGFYSDCVAVAHWSKPSEVIDEPLARSLVGTARALATGRTRKIDSAAGLDLWARHFTGVEPRGMKDALARFYRDAEAAGLVDADEAAKMRRFLGASGGSIRASD